MFANGYRSNPVIEKINIDGKIKCKGCKIVKDTGAFSKKNLYHLKSEIYSAKQAGKAVNTTTREIIPCTRCTPSQQFEFKCHGCDYWKGRDKFSKAQLKNPDRANCWQCMEKRANMEPGGSSEDDSGGDDSDDSDSASDDDGDGAKLPSTMAGLSIGGTSNDASNSATPAASVVGTTTNVGTNVSGFAKVNTVQRKTMYDVNKQTNLSLATGVTGKAMDDVQVADSESDDE